MELIYLKSVLKRDSFDVAICIKIPFFRVLVTIEPGRSLLQFVTTNCLIDKNKPTTRTKCKRTSMTLEHTRGMPKNSRTLPQSWLRVVKQATCQK